MRVLARVLLLAASLAAAEVCLQALTIVSPAAENVLTGGIPRAVPAPSLGLRGNPRFSEHDAAGYRNDERPERAAIVVLGDSQTYGTGVGPDQAWPRLLERQMRQRVYNMAVSGYCPAHGLLQADEALGFTPRYLIVSVYFGNDFFDAFALSKRNAVIAAMAPHDLVEKAAHLELQGALESEVVGLFARSDESREATTRSGGFQELRIWLSRNSRLYGLLRAARHALGSRGASTPLTRDLRNALQNMSPAEQRFCSIVDRPGHRTILTPRYRARVLDDTDPRIRQGVETIKRTIQALDVKSRAAGSTLVAVLIPTKEAVFWPHADRTDSQLAQLVTNEARLREEIATYLRTQDVPFVDLLDPLQQAVPQPYFEDADGHPNEAGHRLIADVVARRVAAVAAARD